MATPNPNNIACCIPQRLYVDSDTGYLSITQGNSVFLGTLVKEFGIDTSVVDFRLSMPNLILEYKDSTGAVQTKIVDLTPFLASGSITVLDTNSIDLTLSSGHLKGDVKISTVAGNAITVKSDGLWSATFVDKPLVAVGCSNISLAVCGTTSDILTACVKVSADPDNKLYNKADGLKVDDIHTYILAGGNIAISGLGTSGSPYIISATPQSNTPISVIPTTTIDMITSGSFAHTLQTSVKISAASGNILSTNPDGLFVPVSSGGGSGGGNILSINGLVAPNQSLLVGSAGTDFNIQSVLSNHTFNLPTASATARGLLSSTDWTTFNGKQDPLVLGNLVETGSSILTITNGNNSVVNSGVTIQVKAANSSQSGYLNTADWNIFNNKQPAIQYQSAGSNIGTPGSTSIVNFTGTAVNAVFSASTTTVNINAVSSVSLTVPGGFNVTGSPITGSGTLTIGTTLTGVIKGNGTGFFSGLVNVTDINATGVADSTTFLRGDGAWVTPGGGGGGGTVTSVALSLPAIFNVTGSPVSGAGTLTGTLANQNANLVWAGPTTGAAAAPSFRSLVNADFPISGVSSGSYTNSNVTVNAQGIITAISSGSGGGGTTGDTLPITTVSTNTTLNTSFYTILVNATTGNMTITLPGASSVFSAGQGKIFNVKKIDSTANQVIIQRTGSDLIDGFTTQVLYTQYDGLQLQSAGSTTWVIL